MPEQPLLALTPDQGQLTPHYSALLQKDLQAPDSTPGQPRRAQERVAGALLLVVMRQAGSEALGAHASPRPP